jgi:hypothetical protein
LAEHRLVHQLPARRRTLLPTDHRRELDIPKDGPAHSSNAANGERCEHSQSDYGYIESRAACRAKAHEIDVAGIARFRAAAATTCPQSKNA